MDLREVEAPVLCRHFVWQKEHCQILVTIILNATAEPNLYPYEEKSSLFSTIKIRERERERVTKERKKERDTK